MKTFNIVLENHRHYRGISKGIEYKETLVNFIKKQNDNTILVELTEDVFGYKKGHKLAILQSQIIIN